MQPKLYSTDHYLKRYSKLNENNTWKKYEIPEILLQFVYQKKYFLFFWNEIDTINENAAKINLFACLTSKIKRPSGTPLKIA